MKKTLQPFQRAGAKFLTERYHALLADEMGLGKTVQALAAVEAHNFKSVAVVCPASVRTGWHQEIVECGLQPSCFKVDSYEALVAGKFPGGAYDCCIIDEAHFLRRGESLRSQAMFNNEDGLARRCKFVWGLTGTPVMNRPRDLFPLLTTMARKRIEKYATFEKFAQHFCGAYWDGHQINTRGASNLDELRQILDGFMLRRTIEEVMPEMPPVLLSRPPLELTAAERGPIDEVEAGILDREAFLSSTREDYAALGDLARLRKATGIAKARKVAEFVEDLIATEGEGRKICVFYRHTAVAKILAEELGHRFPVIYQGGMTDKQKDAAIKTFVGDDNCEIFLGQIQASGTGINGLQKVSSTLVFAELEWSPEEMKQNMARLRRIGMDMGKPVRAYMPHVPGTIESAIIAVNVGKERVIEKVMAPAAAADVLGDLL